MYSTLVILNCSQLVTLASSQKGVRTGKAMGELSIIEDGAMIVRDGRIERTGPRGEIEPIIRADYEVLDAGWRVVMPGFVDAHTHPVFAGTRVPVKTLMDYLEAGDSLDEFLDHFPSVSREQAVAVLELAREMLMAHADTAR